MPAKTDSLKTTSTCQQQQQDFILEDVIDRIKRRKLDNADTATTDAIAEALATAMATSSSPSTSCSSSTSSSSPKDKPQSQMDRRETVAEVRDGVEWVSFVYSHNRTLKRYSIRTDIENVCVDAMDEKFKQDNCVYPRANLPKECYRGNRWAYETECNVLGWKLAWLNAAEISGKRGLIQRAVDSYRNRNPSMRSRRVARQEKLLKGTLRRRKNTTESGGAAAATAAAGGSVVTQHQQQQQKFISIEDPVSRSRLRLAVNVEDVSLETIPLDFQRANCVFPRAMNIQANAAASNTLRWQEEAQCNELGFKLAWLNQKSLAGKKNLLQRALDIYRTRYMPALQPRKNSSRTPALPVPPMVPMPLTASALSAQNAFYAKLHPESYAKSTSSAMSCTSGTTVTLDFTDCLADDDDEEEEQTPSSASPGFNEEHHPSITIPNDEDDSYFSSSSTAAAKFSSCCNSSATGANRCSPCLCSGGGGDEMSISTESYSSSLVCTPSPPATTAFFGVPAETDLVQDSFTLPPVSDDPSCSFSTCSSSSSFSFSSTPSVLFKLYESSLLPSSAVQKQDLVVKIEDDSLMLTPDFTSVGDPDELLCLF